MNFEVTVSPTIEEYLEQIYRLEEIYGVARTKHLAEKVGVSLGTITNTVESIEDQNLVIHKPYKGVKLTDEGRRIALDVIRRHRLSERLLTDFLKIDWSRAHDYACRLEHAIINLSKFLEKALNHPETCPHGNPIPSMLGEIQEKENHQLTNVDEGEKRIVAKIVNERQDLLEYLKSLNLVPGSLIEITRKELFDGSITLEINGEKHALSKKIASNIWVRFCD